MRKLKEFCESVGQQFVKLKGYSKTRFLALKDCLSSIITNFNALKEYFDCIDGQETLKAFFNDPFALSTMVFVRDQSANFETSILQLEGDCVCAVDAANTINQLKTNIESRLQNNYSSLELRAAFAEIGNGYTTKKRQFVDSLKKFHQKTLTYLNKWTKWLDDMKVFSWVSLTEKLSWNNVECAALWMVGRNYFDSNDMDKLFNQFALLEQFVRNNKTSIDNEQSVDKKWVYIFRAFTEKSMPFAQLLKVVEFALVIPATNATAERVFSHINDIWTPEKGSMLVENVRARLMTKFNWKENCLEFHDKIEDDTNFLNKVHSSLKYSPKSIDLFKNKTKDVNEESEPMPSTSMEADSNK